MWSQAGLMRSRVLTRFGGRLVVGWCVWGLFDIGPFLKKRFLYIFCFFLQDLQFFAHIIVVHECFFSSPDTSLTGKIGHLGN